MSVYLLDSETTGTKDPELVEVAWLRLNGPDPLQIVEQFSQWYKPSKPIEFGAMAVHHITNEDVADMPPAATFKMPGDLAYLVGHNVDFDWQVIGKPECKRICTLALARKLWPTVDSHSQGALLYFLEPSQARQRLAGSHRAPRDAENCAFVLERLCLELGVTTWDELWGASEVARVPTHLAFGKHKGTAIVDLPRDYREWMLRQADMDPYVLQAVRASM